MADSAYAPSPIGLCVRGGLRVELLHYASPGCFGIPANRRDRLGMTHFSFVVDDVGAAAAEFERFGGTIVAGRTRRGGRRVMSDEQ